MGNKKDNSKNHSAPFTPAIMIKLGNGAYFGKCLLTERETQEIARRKHNNPVYSRINELTSDVSELGRKLNLQKPVNTSKPLNSRSYIIVTCAEDANPKFNRLELRTDPPTFIELNPGRNILTVEEYPALKYGFRQISENDTETTDESRSHWYQDNCQEVMSVDMTNFDSSEMTSMNSMFEFMQNIRLIDLGNLNTSRVTDMAYAFYGACIEGEIKGLENLDTKCVTDMSHMFELAGVKHIDLQNFKVSSLENSTAMLACIDCDLNIDGWHVNKKALATCFFEGGDLPASISMKGCDAETIRWIAQDLVYYAGEDGLKRLILDDDIKLSCYQDEDIITVGVHHIHTCKNYNSKIQYSEDGKTLISADKDIEIAIIKPGVITVADNAFKDCRKLHTVYIHPDVLNIGANAFAGCESLKWITPIYVKRIGHGAFQGCINLSTVYFEDSLRFLGEFAFRGSGVEFIQIPLPSDTNYGFAFDGATALKYIQLVRYNKEQFPDCVFRPDHTNFEYVPRITVVDKDSYSSEYPMSFNGVLCELLLSPADRESEEEYDLVTATIVPDSTIVIPESVEVLGRYCLGTRKCPFLYIPESVQFINEDVLDSYHGTLMTLESNLEHLLSILPSEAGDISILTI